MKYCKFNLFIMVIGALFCTAPAVFSQVNTENLRQGRLQDGLHGKLSMDYNLVSGNSEFAELKGNIRLDYVREKHYTFGVMEFQRSEQNEQLFIDKGFIHFRGM